MNGGRQADGLFQPRFTVAQGTRAARLGLDMHHQRRAPVRNGRHQCQASPGSSWSWIGPSGITVEMACL